MLVMALLISTISVSAASSSGVTIKNYTAPDKLKEVYKSAMHNVMIGETKHGHVEKQEFNIIINVFLSGKEYNIQ